MPTEPGPAVTAGGREEPLIRRARPDESRPAADLLWAVREQSLALGFIPRGVHPLDEMREWMRDVVFARDEVWVAESDGRLVGLLVLRQPDWIEHLYIDASATDRGLGSRLVDVAKRELAGDRAQLWTFQSNTGARRFYERHGFVAVDATEGDNEERAPDVRYLWRRPDAQEPVRA